MLADMQFECEKILSPTTSVKELSSVQIDPWARLVVSDPADIVVGESEPTVLEQILAPLTDDHLDVFEWRQEGLTRREIADRIGRSAKVVKRLEDNLTEHMYHIVTEAALRREARILKDEGPFGDRVRR